MAAKIRWATLPELTLDVSIERYSDGLWFDFAASSPTAGQFTANPQQPYLHFPEAPSIGGHDSPGRYALDLPTPPADWPDDDYIVGVHQRHLGGAPQVFLTLTIRNGDGATWPPAGLAITIPAFTVPASLVVPATRPVEPGP